jgi:hypothetical protein
MARNITTELEPGSDVRSIVNVYDDTGSVQSLLSALAHLG